MRSLSLSLLLAACAPSVTESEPTDDSDPAGPDFAAVEAALASALTEAPDGIDGLALIVVDTATDRVVLRSVHGDFDPDEVIPVASASKLVSGLVLLRVVQRGDLSLDDTTGEVLGWPADRADITLDHLGAFASGLPGEHPCTLRVRVSLQDCVEDIEGTALVGGPGERFEYGSTHQHVAAAMAEVRTGRSWAGLFDEELRAPLGLASAEQVYATYPKQAEVSDNPLIAGGLRTSTSDYLPFLGLVARRGEHDGEQLIDGSLVDRMFENRYPDATIGSTPDAAEDYRYGWSGWLHCDGAVSTCDVMGSAGAFGFVPWVDREHGYHAVLAMESDRAGGSQWAVPLYVELEPMIVDALGR